MRSSSAQGIVVVTGSSSGIGQATTRALASDGFRVLAGVRSADDAERLAEQPGVEAVMLDITDDSDIAALADRVAAHARDSRLLAVVNNAGIALNAPVELLPMAEWRRQFEVNFFGHVAMTRALLPLLLESRGRVVNISSIGGLVAGPTFGAYAASKFALEAMSDALRREVARLGVDVVVVEPGAVATPIWGKGLVAYDKLAASLPADRRARYDALTNAVAGQAEAMARDGVEPDAVAATIVRAIRSARPRTRYVVGRDARVAARAARLLPDRVFDALIARGLRLPRPGRPTQPRNGGR